MASECMTYSANTGEWPFIASCVLLATENACNTANAVTYRPKRARMAVAKCGGAPNDSDDSKRLVLENRICAAQPSVAA